MVASTKQQPRERPILFSAPMVRAILAGRKMQTRRVMREQPPAYQPGPLRHRPKHNAPYFDAYDGGPFWCWWSRDDRQGPGWIRCPYGVPGDRLWVKETWRPQEAALLWDLDINYAADGETRTIKDGEFGDRDWKAPKAAARGNVSALFMPRWASRITLEITEVRVERLQDITEEDACAEGALADRQRAYENGETLTDGFPSARRAFQRLWKNINGVESWDGNPWVWAISFRRLSP